MFCKFYEEKRRKNMELLQLRYFCEAAKCENFSTIAKKYDVPTSAVSQSVRRLEKELGSDLFNRSANKIKLNEKGQAFFDKVIEGIGLLDSAKAEVLGASNSKIDICINTNRRIVMQAVEKFKKSFPDVEVRTKIFSDPAMNPFDIVVTYNDKSLVGYEKTKLLSEQLALAVLQDNPLASGEFSIAKFKDEPFVTTSEAGSLFAETENVCMANGFKPKIAVQSDDPFYLRKCVEFGLGVAVVPLFSWQGQFSENVKLFPLEGYIRDTYLYTDKGRPLSETALCFIELLKAECENK